MMAQVPSAPSEISSSHASQASAFLKALHRALQLSLVPEMELTMRVAVLSAAGHTRPEIVRALGAQEIEVKMALIRLQRVAEVWK